MILIGVVVFVVVFVLLVHALNRAAARGDEQMEEPAEWDDPDWEWPVWAPERNVDSGVRETGRVI